MQRSTPGHPGWPLRAARTFNRLYRACLVAVLTTALLLAIPAPALAQDDQPPSPTVSPSSDPGPDASSPLGGRSSVSGLDSSQFPTISFNLDVFNTDNTFASGLTPAGLALTEDGQPVQAEAVTPYTPGLQLTVALTASAQLNAYVGDQPQLELVRSALLGWVAAQPTGQGIDFSFSTDAGLQLIRSDDPQQWATVLSAYTLPADLSAANLNSLSTAVDLASDQAAGPQARKAILLITPPIPTDQTAALEELSARAYNAGARVFVWVPVTTIEATPPDTANLQAMTDSTGGRLTLIAGAETIPGLDSWLAPLRQGYKVSYTSPARQSGAHNLSVSLTGSDAPAQTLTYTLELAAPNPIFLAPPALVERVWQAENENADPVLNPLLQPIAILVEFPDKVERPLTSARLYVDGELAQENTTPPFEAFAWDLTALEENGAHSLRVEVSDSLGFTGSSAETAVEVTVQPRPALGLFQRISDSGLIAVGAVILAGGVLALVLIGENRLRAGRRKASRRSLRDPVTQPVPISQEHGKSNGRGRRPAGEPGSWPKTVPLPGVAARLIRVTEDEQAVPGSLIPLNRGEITLGSDLRKSIILVEDPSVEKLHARLVRAEDGGFILHDEDSAAGAWVNYSPVPPDGARLCHDDLIHLGRVMFRYEVSAAPPPRLPTVKPSSMERAV